jgi:cysteinyl-tRNA synthetase
MKIYNSLTKQKEAFKPITPNHVKMYVCGITVYDYCHIGHARSFIVFDMITRYFRARGYNVNYVCNITDIDDKIIQRAKENGEKSEALTMRFIEAFQEDKKALDILPPDHEPRATQYIIEICELIQELLDNGSAYVADNGDVCFDVRKFKGYGKLSHRNLDDLIAGARVEVEQSKRDPLDFVLWKVAKPDEPHWSSPWGDGRPGWHIECSAMSTKMLGQPFDIHGGGLDLKFPHHENEIAQSEAAKGKAFANIWMHAGLLQVDGEKMSKSLGNFFTIREVLEKYSSEEIRFFMLSSHYRSPVNYSESNLAQAHQALVTLYTALRDLPDFPEKNTQAYQQQFEKVMDDDFNTPQAISVLFEMAKEINRLREQGHQQKAAEVATGLKRLAGTFGFLQQDPTLFLQGDNDAEEIENLIAERNQARHNKDWAEADRIRHVLDNLGVIIEDNPQGTTWRRG